MTTPPKLLVALLALASCLPAQTPAAPRPAGETAAPDVLWTADEAFALSWLAHLAELGKARLADIAFESRLRRSSALAQAMRPVFTAGGRTVTYAHGGYRIALFAEDEGGELGATAIREGGGWAFYAWPMGESDDAMDGRVFFVSSAGPIAFAENRERYVGDTGPEPNAALGAGGTASLAHVQRTPGMGQDGQLWMTIETVPAVERTVEVALPEGVDASLLEVAVVPLGFGDLAPTPLDGAFVASAPQSAESGTVRLRGPLAKGLGVIVAIGDMAIAPEEVVLLESGLRIAISRDEIVDVRCRANESAVLATLKNISSAQSQCQASGVIDANGNGAGEYGYFVELSGGQNVRGADHKIVPPVLSGAFANVRDGVVMRSGYRFRMFLPDADYAPLAEADTGGAGAAVVDPKRAEVAWCCYAWPAAPGLSGKRAFFINQAGDVLASEDAMEGVEASTGLPAMSAFVPGAKGLDAQTALNVTGTRGRWTVVN